ncbi:MAG: hydrogenase expression/formation protein HypE [Ignavibacteria bacterium]|nr:hydrogenase expression/formation protein HypE [Ignavibacteria bacterium]
MEQEKNTSNKINLSCPLPITNYDKILLAHGGGGSLMHDLIEKLFLRQFENPILNTLHDGAILEIDGLKIAFTTDSFVVDPIFFPGGNIGSLAVFGTINDLSVCGAKPLYISVSFIIEEGLPIEELWEIVQSMKNSAELANVKIVTGDTKVVERGKGDKIFINTTGIGIVRPNLNISPKNCKPNDIIIINGRIAEHGIAIISKRQGFEFETEILSDSAPLNGLVEAILETSDKVKMMRDPTRGGLASVLNEIAISSGFDIMIEECAIPISEEVKGACEILGFDPLYVANEGKLIVIVAPEDAEKVLQAMKNHPYGKDSAIIGKVMPETNQTVTLKTIIGTTRIIDMLSGEQLPRIC